ncbi:transglycosylase SLT domain-containing protein [Silvibacterium bohemicum]|nr:transglycosylase SLT domain-containing protein [Silvibacterium bohemicum]
MSAFQDLGSIAETLGNSQGSPAGSSNSGEDLGANSSSNPEQEIEQALAALVQDLQQLAAQLDGGAQGQNDGSGGGPPSVGSGGGGRSSLAAEPQPGAVDNQAPPAASTPAASATGGASSTSSANSASGAGALGPNVPSALQPFVQDINAASKQTGVPASLIGAQILQESGGNPNAVTTNPALGLPDTGLMQVDQATFQGLQSQYPSLLGGKSVSDPATNIMAGALLDSQLLKQNNGNISAALTAYNGSADPSYVNEVTSKMNALQNGTPVPGGFS